MKNFILISLTLVVIVNYACAFTAQKDGKLVVRTKRQQCICVYISAQQSQIQCSCDQNTSPLSNNKNYSPAATQIVQQQELQNELQQIQPFSSSKCGCVLIVVKNKAYGSQSPQYQCSCAQESGEPMTTTTTTTIAPTTINFRNEVLGAINKDGVTNPCRCVKLPMSANSDSTQYQCNCRNQKTIVKESDLLEHGNNVVIEDSTQSPTMVPMIEYEVLPALTQTTSAPATLYTPEEPAITQCILIKIPSQDKQACVCSENYSQCTENSCCHKRMRSMRPGVAKSSPSKTENAVDLLMDVLKKIKTNL